MAKVVTISVGKGGTGKTTTAINLAASLARIVPVNRISTKVLLIDLDHQANAGIGIGIYPTDNHMLHTVYQDDVSDIENMIVHTKFGFDFISAGTELQPLEMNMRSKKIKNLSRALTNISGKYDCIVIDTPPNYAYLTLSAILSSTHVIIPFQAEKFSYEAIKQSYDEIQDTIELYNGQPLSFTLFSCMEVKRSTVNRGVFELVAGTYPEITFPDKVYVSQAIKEAQMLNMPLHFYDESHAAIEVYDNLAKHILGV